MVDVVSPEWFLIELSIHNQFSLLVCKCETKYGANFVNFHLVIMVMVRLSKARSLHPIINICLKGSTRWWQFFRFFLQGWWDTNLWTAVLASFWICHQTWEVPHLCRPPEVSEWRTKNWYYPIHQLIGTKLHCRECGPESSRVIHKWDHQQIWKYLHCMSTFTFRVCTK